MNQSCIAKFIKNKKVTTAINLKVVLHTKLVFSHYTFWVMKLLVVNFELTGYEICFKVKLLWHTALEKNRCENIWIERLFLLGLKRDFGTCNFYSIIIRVISRSATIQPFVSMRCPADKSCTDFLRNLKGQLSYAYNEPIFFKQQQSVSRNQL